MTTPNIPNDSNDDSIIGISDQLYKMNSGNGLKKYPTRVPYWERREVYTLRGMNGASDIQKNFYKIFKYSFLRREYFNLEGNFNYAFVLYFELLDEYDVHKDVSKIESQLKILGQCYPQTRSFGIAHLMQRMEIKGDREGIEKLKAAGWDNYEDLDSNYESWGLGSKYKDKLKLSEEETKLIDILEYPNNSFGRIEYCCHEIIKLYRAVIARLKAGYIREGTTLDDQFKSVAEVVAKKHFRYKEGSPQYNYYMETIPIDFYRQICKHCEKALREHYRHTRKMQPDTRYEEAKNEIDSKIISKVTAILSVLIHTVPPPDEDTEIELNALNPTRWKTTYVKLTTGYNGKPKKFVKAMVGIAKVNEYNPVVKNTLFEAVKFMAKYDREATLSLYILYTYYHIEFNNFNHVPLPESIRKNLFRPKEQFLEFEAIVDELFESRDLDKAFADVSKMFGVKRKKIELNTASIKEAQQQHSGTVELLNEYLRDDLEEENNSIKSREINSEEIKIEITQKSEENYPSPFVSELSFTPIHAAMLELFAKNNFTISANEIESFAKAEGVLKNHLIESINDKCYEFLDDLLIEEEEDYYTINTNYFQRISTQ